MDVSSAFTNIIVRGTEMLGYGTYPTMIEFDLQKLRPDCTTGSENLP
jgi:hypothetical protein